MRVAILISVLMCGCGGREAGKPGSLSVKFQGHYADYWGEKLMDADPGTSGGAADALREIGEEGAPYALIAMQSGKTATRLNGLLCTYRTPGGLGWGWGSTDDVGEAIAPPPMALVPAIRAQVERMAKDDPDSNVKRLAGEIVDDIYLKKRRKKIPDVGTGIGVTPGK